MATLKCCDLCKGHPLDLDAQCGGDVRSALLEIEGEMSPNSPGSPIEHYEFDICAPCRGRVLGEVLRNIAPGPPTATQAIIYPQNRRVA